MNKVKTYITGQVISSNDSEAFSLYKKSFFGEIKEGKIYYSVLEAIFLLEKGKIDVYQFINKKKKISKDELINRARKNDNKIFQKYIVFKDLREKGYIVKTALKFGAEFRVYDKGQKPGKEHAKWLLFTDNESAKLSWQDFSAKNRVAHSTRKNLLIAIIDEEGDIIYYEVKWVRP